MEPSEAVPPATEPGLADQLPPEVAELGQRISRTLLRDEGREDIAAAWIGMRIAQLMHDAEHASTDAARAAAATACQELVLAAWERRQSWPRGWPPRGVSDVAAALDRIMSPHPTPRMMGSGAGWAGQLDEVLQSLQHEQRLWTLLALRDLDPDGLDAWLSAGTLEADEDAALHELSRRARDSVDVLHRLLPPKRRLDRSTKSVPSQQVVERAVRELKRLARARLEVLGDLTARLPSEQSDP